MKKTTCIRLLLAHAAVTAAAACGEEVRPAPIWLPQGKTDSPSSFEVVKPEDCPGGAPLLPGGSPAAWTVMVYAAGDNNLEDYVIDDINEMEAGHGGTDQVNVIVQLDKLSERGVWRYRIAHDADRRRITSPLAGFSEEEPDSGSWLTLASFGEWAVTCYPAFNFMLIIEGHGNGWSDSDDPGVLEARDKANEEGETFRELALDDTNGSSIYIGELAMALEHIAAKARFPGDPPYMRRLVIYGSDACLMQTIEVGWQIMDDVTYILGSEESEPATGWPYDTILRELTSRPYHYSEMPHKLAEITTQSYGTAYGHGGEGGEDRITLSAVNANYFPGAETRVKKIASILRELLPDIHRQVWSARDRSFDFGETYTDLGKFLVELRGTLVHEGLMPETGQAWEGDARYRKLRDETDGLTQLLPDLVAAHSAGSKFEGASGISIFFPYGPSTWFLDLEKYARCPFGAETGWDKLVTTLIQEYPYDQH
jgi:hypothetical protein